MLEKNDGCELPVKESVVKEPVTTKNIVRHDFQCSELTGVKNLS